MIRPTLPADLPALRAIWNPLIRDTLVTFSSEEKSDAAMADYLQTRNAAGYGTFTALKGNTPVGFASYSQFRGGTGYARSMEHTIILGEAGRGGGLGRALMAAIEVHAQARGVHVMMAGVSGGNPDGVAFHAALNYALVGTIPHAGWKFGRYWDLLLMQKILT